MSARPSLGRRETIRMLAVAGAAVGLGGGLVRELVRRGGLSRVSRTESHMGTLVTLVCVHPEAPLALEAIELAFRRMDRLEAVLSRHDPGAQLARLNRDGVLESPDPALVEVLEAGRRYSEMSEGAFDVTIAPLVDLFASRFRSGRKPPTPREITAARERVNYRVVESTPEVIRFSTPNTKVSLDGIAKGYIVDRTVESFVKNGFTEVLVDAGGDIGSAGAGSEGSGWPVAVEVPSASGRRVARTRLRGGALASSGDWYQAFAEDRSAHHIVDPRTGRSPLELRAVSVRGASAMDADALSTAVMVLGVRDGLALLDRMPGVEGLVVRKDGGATPSAGWGSGVYSGPP